MPKMRVAVALSGGVDSLLATALLKESGYDVSGFHMKLWDDPDYPETIASLNDACRRLDVPLHTLNLEAEFEQAVISYFRREYSRGRTPNPCSLCNRDIKFGALLRAALETGADYFATGHYARVEESEAIYRLLKGTDKTKDQSYFLYTLGQNELKHLLLPLGSLKKTEVKKLAAERGLTAHARRESRDVCFIPDGDYRTYLSGYISTEPGEITDTSGRVLGQHNGLAYYTIGQRQKLGLSSPERLYVLRLDTDNNRLIVGGKDELMGKKLAAASLSWVAGKTPEDLSWISARIRYQSQETPVIISLSNDRAEVTLLTPQNAITPGQAIVFYRGETVLGGGIIEERLA